MKKIFLLLFLLPINSCVTTTENITFSYSNTVESLDQSEPMPVIEKKPVKVVINDSCYETLKPLLEKGIPTKPDVSVITNIDETLIKSLQEHRQYIKELTDKINSCQH